MYGRNRSQRAGRVALTTLWLHTAAHYPGPHFVTRLHISDHFVPTGVDADARQRVWTFRPDGGALHREAFGRVERGTDDDAEMRFLKLHSNG